MGNVEHYRFYCSHVFSDFTGSRFQTLMTKFRTGKEIGESTNQCLY